VLVKADGKVDAADAVPALAKFFIGVDRTDARSFAYIFRDAAHRDGGMLPVKRVARRDGLSWLAIVGHKESDIRMVDLSRDADAVLGMHNAARVDEINGRNKVVGVLKKERPQLGKINREALIDGELWLLGFDIAEVGIDGGVDNDAVLQDQLGLAAIRAFKVTRAEVGIGGVDVDKGALILCQRVRIQLKIVRAADAFDPVQNAFLAKDAGDVGGYARP